MSTAGKPERSAWYEIVLPVPRPEVELVDAWCVEAGCTGLEHRDQDHLIPPEALLPGWVEVHAFFSANDSPEVVKPGLERFLTTLSASLSSPSAIRPRVKWLEPEDWANSWREHFHPVRAGGFFIHPGWEEVDRSAPWPLCIEPGLAFGTGLHPTTHLCLLGLDSLLKRGSVDSLLDLGCGTGILALAGARAGVSRVVAVDNDPEACRVAAENLDRNGLEGRVGIRLGGLEVVQEQYQVVVANILSGTLLEMSRDLFDVLAPGGALLLSGLLVEEAQLVTDGFVAAGFRSVGCEIEGEWALVQLTR